MEEDAAGFAMRGQASTEVSAAPNPTRPVAGASGMIRQTTTGARLPIDPALLEGRRGCYKRPVMWRRACGESTAPETVPVRRYVVVCPVIPEPHWQTGL